MNEKNSILLIDPDFNPVVSEHCTLLLRVSIDSFSYSIIDKRTNKIYAIYDEQDCDEVTKKVAELLNSDPHFKLNYNNVKCSLHAETNIFIPNSIYESKEYNLNSSFYTNDIDILEINSHKALGFTSAFSINRNLTEILASISSSIKIFNPFSALLKLAEGLSLDSLLFDFTAGSMQVLYLKEGKVIFNQYYEVADGEEFQYFVLLLIHQLNIDTGQTDVYASGIIHENDEKHNCLKQYFKTVQFLDYVNLGDDQEVLEDMPLHYYTTLLALGQCE
ncbi:MAG: DUF3822 family protein [Pedobacter sp.]|nr:MAG: DUF3822 family protein [Pedobacter sp.]